MYCIYSLFRVWSAPWMLWQSRSIHPTSCLRGTQLQRGCVRLPKKIIIITIFVGDAVSDIPCPGNRRAASQPHKETKLSDFLEFSSNNSAIFFGRCWIIVIIILITTGININMMRGGTERLRVSGQLPSLHLDTRGVAWFQVWACPWWWWWGGG